jgi:DNA invertase Pin-like site-specific DNA recombinase
MRVGYARVSTRDQDAAMQAEALTAAGCEKIFEETASGAQKDRPELVQAIAYLRKGDVLTVWKLDRLARSLKQLIDTVEELERRGIGFVSLTESIDTTTPGGRLVFHLFGSLAEFERELIRERTNAGLKSAKARGVKLGRPKALEGAGLKMALAMKAAGTMTATEIANQVGVSRASLYRALAAQSEALDQ